MTIKRALSKKEKPGLWGIVCDMEAPVQTVIDYADALAVLAESIDELHGRIVHRLAWSIKDAQQEVEKQRGLLFSAMHPNAKGGARS